MPKAKVRRRVQHFRNLRSNIAEVTRLGEIHQQIAGPGPGYKHNVQVLNKSGVVLLTATWESFVEDLAEGAYTFLLRHAKTPEAFSTKVLALVAKNIAAKEDDLAMWDLAGNNWRDVLRAHKNDVMERYLGRFHTPKHEQIDDLFQALLGLRYKMSSHWKWANMSAEQSRRKLNRFVELRGAIAHRVDATKSVNKSYVTDHQQFIRRLAVITSNKIRLEVKARTRRSPWTRYKFKSSR